MTNRLSRPVPNERGVSYLGSQAHFLVEDFDRNVVPYLKGGDAYRLKASGIPTQSVYGSLAIDRDARDLVDFIRTIASLLLIDRDVWLEVAISSKQESATQFQVCIVNGVHQEASGRIVQKLPSRDDLPAWYPEDEAWGQTVQLDPDLMVNIALPELYPEGLIQSVMSELAKIGTLPTPEWALKQLVGQYPGTPRFDLAEAYRIQRLRILEVSSPLGWAAREGLLSHSAQEMSYYYYLLRELRFLHFVASMRERAEAGLVKVLEIAGERCGFSTTVTAHGVLTPTKVCNLIRSFESGSLSFAAARDIKYQRGVYPPREWERSL